MDKTKVSGTFDGGSIPSGATKIRMRNRAGAVSHILIFLRSHSVSDSFKPAMADSLKLSISHQIFRKVFLRIVKANESDSAFLLISPDFLSQFPIENPFPFREKNMPFYK
jgi:hypothetical protein